MCNVLIIDDEEGALQAVRRRLERAGLRVRTASSADEGAKAITEAEKPFDVVVTDMSMENAASGLAIIEKAFTRDLFAQVIVLTAYGAVPNAVEAMKRGAFDYLEKNSPTMDAYELLPVRVNQALERRKRDMNALIQFQRAAMR